MCCINTQEWRIITKPWTYFMGLLCGYLNNIFVKMQIVASNNLYFPVHPPSGKKLYRKFTNCISYVIISYFCGGNKTPEPELGHTAGLCAMAFITSLTLMPCINYCACNLFDGSLGMLVLRPYMPWKAIIISQVTSTVWGQLPVCHKRLCWD